MPSFRPAGPYWPAGESKGNPPEQCRQLGTNCDASGAWVDRPFASASARSGCDRHTSCHSCRAGCAPGDSNLFSSGNAAQRYTPSSVVVSPMTESGHGPLRLMYSYSHSDEKLKEELDAYLARSCGKDS
jgi:hypothetical protein